MASGKGGGVSLSTILLILFIVLKLTHMIDWSWLWVLSPLWIPIAIFLVVAFLGVLGVAVLGNR